MSKGIAGANRQARTLRTESRIVQTEADRDSEFKDMSIAALDNFWLSQDLTLAQKEALDYYQGSGYAKINNYLRGNGQGEGFIDNYVTQLNSINMVLTENVTLHRAIKAYASDTGKYTFVESFFNAFKNGTIVGSRFEDKAFSSTSAGDSPAMPYIGSDSQYGASRGVHFKIRARKGSRVIIPSRNNGYSDENEVLLPSGGKFRIVNARYGQNEQSLVVELELE